MKMAARLFSRPPAISPDRFRANKSTTANVSPSSPFPPEPAAQYASFRKALNPAYDSLRFVRIPPDRLPDGIASSSSKDDSQNLKLEWWPALVYESLAELVRDCPSGKRSTKAKLIVEHTKNGRQVVARLIGWKNLAMGGLSSSKKESSLLFHEPKLELIRLPGKTIQENEDGVNGKRHLLCFLDYHCELEPLCEALLENLDARNDKNSMAVHFALQFRRACDMASNCLAMDVGGENDLVPLRNYVVPSRFSKKAVADGESVSNQSIPNADARASTVRQKRPGKEKKGAEPAMKKSTMSKQNPPTVKGSPYNSEGISVLSKSSIMRNIGKVSMPTMRLFPEKSNQLSGDSKEFIPPIIGEKIKSDDDWHSVWEKMLNSGWYCKYGSGLMLDYYYIKPGKNVKNGTEGVDYFTQVKDVQLFAKKNYGWKGKTKNPQSKSNFESMTSSGRKRRGSQGNTTNAEPTSRKRSKLTKAAAPSATGRKDRPQSQTKKSKMTDDKFTSAFTTPRDRKTKPQDPAAPLLPTPPTTGSDSSASSFYDFQNLWPRLQKYGWRLINAGKYNRLHDWYYVRPNFDPGDASAVLGEHYFTSEFEVIQYAKAADKIDSRLG
mmetsp:Transcript_5113/g.11266  ORF Transcript_5113/g.11266 Transcript_5113/m.11266 type:complete len:607 (+) Transcript_5113:307-2127(+)